MRPPTPSAFACSAFFAITAFAAPAFAQGTPIFTETQTIAPSLGGGNFGHN